MLFGKSLQNESHENQLISWYRMFTPAKSAIFSTLKTAKGKRQALQKAVESGLLFLSVGLRGIAGAQVRNLTC